MAEGVQLENGYMRVANELMDAILCAGLGKREIHIAIAVMRQTYGYSKREDDVTVSRLARITAMRRPHASEALASLVSRGIVQRKPGKYGYILSINKDYRGWTRPETGQCPETGRGASRNGTGGVPKRDTHNTTPNDNPISTIPTGSPCDPRKALWDLGVSILGERSRSLIGKACKDVGEQKVGQVLAEMALSEKADPVAYFRAACKGYQGGSIYVRGPR